MIHVEKIDNTIEELIITGIIVDTGFLQNIDRAIRPEYFVTDVNRILVSWIKEYFKENKVSPGEEITDIFRLNQGELDEDESKTVRIFLNKISKEYEGREFNSEYVLPKAFKYLELNAYDYKVKLLKRELRRGNLEKVKHIFNGATKDIFEQVTAWKSLSDISLLQSWWGEKQEPAMSFPGELGIYMPNIERGRLYAMLGPPKRGKCLSGNSLIHLSDGRLLPLKQVITDKVSNVLCKDSDNKIINGTVTDWIDSGLKDRYDLLTKSGRSISISKDHRFFTPTGWKKLCELKKGDLISTVKSVNINNKSNYPKEKLKLFAYLIADGHLKQNISFTKHDPEIMNDFIQCIKYFNNDFSVKNGVARIFQKGKIKKELQKAKLLGTLSGDKFIPDFIVTASKESITIFLQALFTCDGSIFLDGNTVNIEYSSKSKLLIDQICNLLYRFSIYMKKKTKKVNGIQYYHISCSSFRNTKKYMDKIGFIGEKQRKGLLYCEGKYSKRDYLDIMPKEYIQIIGDEIKKEKKGFNNYHFKTRYDNKKNGSRSMMEDLVDKNHPYLDNDILWDKIVAITKNGKEQMYDLSIKNNHNFIADGFIVHNSYWLMEWAYNGAWDGLNVVLFSLEMASHEVDARWKERISAKAIMPRRNREFTIPVKDCVHNQKNTCQIEQCTSPGTCVYEDKLRESYEDHPEHVACTYCEGIDDELFKPTYWMEKTTLARLSLKEASTTQEQFDDHVGKDRIRIITYPIASATVQDLENSLNELERHENFIPDLIVIDYADILKEDLKLGDKRHRVGDNWQKLSRMAKVRNAIVVTASQGNRSSAKKNRLDVDDVSEDFSKVMTIDGIFAINEVNFDQPDKWQVDKNWQIQRIETIALRYGKFTPGLQCVVMNDLARAQIHIDSYISWK